MGGEDSEVPLLSEGEQHHEGQAATQLERGLEEPPRDFEGILSENPQGVIAYLQDQGLRKLGELDVSVATYRAAADAGEYVTMGSESHAIDVEAVWPRYLSGVAKRPKGHRKRLGTDETLKVEAFVVAVRNPAASDNVGIVQPLLERVAAGQSTKLVFALPAVQSVVHYKWQAFASNLVWVQLAIYLTWLFSFTGFAWVFQDEDPHKSLWDLVHTRQGILGLVLATLSFLSMTPFLYIEVASYHDFGTAWFNFQNGLDVATYVLQAIVTFVYVSRKGVGTDWMTIIMAVQCLLLWFRLQYYLRVFRATSQGAFLDSLKDVVADIKYYLLFMLFTIWGFASAFHILYKRQQKHFEEFSTMPMSMWTLFTAAIGNFENETYLDEDAPPFAVVFFIIYTFVISIILFNLLITLLTDAYSQRTGNAGLREVVYKAEICDELEQTFPAWLVRRKQKKWFPSYIHVLKAKDDVSLEVKNSPLWGADTLLDPTAQVHMRLEKVEEKLDQVLTELQTLRRSRAQPS